MRLSLGVALLLVGSDAPRAIFLARTPLGIPRTFFARSERWFGDDAAATAAAATAAAATAAAAAASTAASGAKGFVGKPVQ
jgi:hypothetical protein